MFNVRKYDNPFVSGGNTAVSETIEEAVIDTMAQLPQRRRNIDRRRGQGRVSFPYSLNPSGIRTRPHKIFSSDIEPEVPRLVLILQKQLSHDPEREDQIVSSKVQEKVVIGSNEKLRRVESQFIVKEKSSVKRFLINNIFLIDLIFEARTRIAKYFNSATPLALSLTQYPDEEIEELYLLIQTNLSVKESLPALDRFEEEWWLDALPRAKCKMTIKLEYI